MATRKPKPLPDDLPAVDALPPLPLDHPLLHAIINQHVGGTSKTALAAKLGLPLSYVKAVVYTYLERYE